MLRPPDQYVFAGTLRFCVIGAYSLQQRVFDVGVMIVCGVIGYGLRKIDLPLAPLVLGLILGPLIEQSLRPSLEMSGGDFSILYTRPICLGLLLARGRRPRWLAAATAAARGARFQGLNGTNQKEERP